ncbi:MAG: DEAD/DEAH box helicase [Betaproteobacteria bacterium]|nr:DEAD/DEAH box helicase [Betaproteobacteria bacterium]
MESRNARARQYIASQAHLLGAIRLPKGCFDEIAGTQTQADILFLKKREGSEPITANWLAHRFAPQDVCKYYGNNRPIINEWFASQPQWLIGRVELESNGYEKVPTAVFDGELEPALQERIALLPQGVYRAVKQSPIERREIIRAEPGARSGTFQIRNGRLFRVAGQELVDVHETFNATQRERIKGMSAIRDHARALLDAQISDRSDERLIPLRATLNGVYDAYVKKYGYLSTRANSLAFRRDPDYPLLLSLEVFDEETGLAHKAAIFRERTLNHVATPTIAADPVEALAASMQWKGRVDMAFMAELLEASEEEVIAALSQARRIFRDPTDAQWKSADEYLSGNVRAKLVQAQASGAGYQENIEALKLAQPEDIPPESIVINLGAAWVPAADVEAFVHEFLEIKDCVIRHSAQAGAWSVRCDDWTVKQSIKTTQEYGTSRINAIQLIQYALNAQTPTVKDKTYDGRTVVNSPETLAAREKLGLLKEKFSVWIFEDIARRKRLCALYNELFNAVRPRKFDGSHLKLPGYSRCFELRAHQLNAAWRIVQSGNTGLFHAVGAGKTATCAVANMELRRLGFASKPCHAVPNHMLQQYTAEFVRLYPQASVLMASKEDLSGERRQEFVSRIATGNFDAIIMTHASFERIKPSVQYTIQFIKEVIEDIRLAILAMRDERSNRIVKQLETIKKVWEARLSDLSAQEKKDDILTWEQLGIDWLFIDEAHLFKNLFRFSKMQVAGLPLTSSQRAFDLYVKTRYTMQRHEGRQRGVVFATATPVANTMAEIHTMMRYLQPARLTELGLYQFDAWAATFGEAVTALEIAPDGSGYRMHTRFARFVNIPELMSIFGEMADVQTAEMLGLPVPPIKGGKARVVACPASTQLKAFVQTLVERAAKIREGDLDPREDNMLSVTTDGRKAALDFRLISPTAEFDEQGKVAACTQETVRIWKETHSFRGAQLIFSDLGAPKGEGIFSIYDDLRSRLIAYGIPSEEIAFIHDAGSDTQKAKLFKSVREGRVRILLGSTPKMGIGTNVQNRLVAKHDLDAPWRPCDIEQRDGRILRQGNLCDEVELIRYVTEGSFDAYLWQTLETKARFIAQVMRGDQSLRSVEDVALATLSYAEVKALASGNPLIIEKAGVDAEAAKLSTLHCVWRSQQYANEHTVIELTSAIAAAERKITAMGADLERIEPQTMSSISIEIGKHRLCGPDAVGERLREIVLSAKRANTLKPAGYSERIIGRFAGLDLGLRTISGETVPELFLQGKAMYTAKPYQQGPALVAALLETLSMPEKQHGNEQAFLESMRKRLVDLQQQMLRPFEHENRLSELLKRQAELLEVLDITKNEAGSHQMDTDTVAAEV